MLEFRAAGPDDYEPVRQLLAAQGWRERTADAERFRRMLENTKRTVVALDDGRVVGFARALCDEVSNGYISTVAVAEEMRGRGVGRELVRRLMGDDPRITWLLRAAPASRGFWKRMGFEPSEVVMERVRI